MSDGSTSSPPRASEQFFHTILSLRDVQRPGPDRVFPLGTHIDLGAAKDNARIALADLGYHADDFVKFEVVKDSEIEDGLALRAKAVNDCDVWVGIKTTPFDERLASYTPEIPGVYNQLQYVIRTIRGVNPDGLEMGQNVEIEGVYLDWTDATQAVQQRLAKGTSDGSIERYEQRLSPDNEGDEWPYGGSIVAHAVESTGANHYIAIETVAGAHRWHKKNRTSALQGDRCFTQQPSELQQARVV